ncbi:pentatricopeptide repeat-containing protein At1g05750, chloroplastic [Jatropha curcas]|uniref:pentatricopeptide repeat-containing protein At1g05750, chloroplastic n=1 Tax=Jatropha curcas TaxID=180498 RepID=UPI0005FBAAC1|nr:pentatricopeptide repeat-containing protein At1g05750, chloroplastic [Jatropha curcas]
MAFEQMALTALTSVPTITQLPHHANNKPTLAMPHLSQHQNRSQFISCKPNLSVKQQSNKPIDLTVAFTSSISRHCRNGKLPEAASQFIQMLLCGVEPNHITFTTLLSGCADFPLEGKSFGPSIHSYARKVGLDTCNVIVGTALVDMYAKCGHIELARLCFNELKTKNSVSWNTMIDGYMRNTKIEDAIELFNEMPERDKISWTVLIDGFVKKGHFEQGLQCFREMQVSNVEPDYVTIIAVLSACANLGALGLGMWIHRYILKQEFRDNVRISNSLIDMYARCGYIGLAQEVFHKMLKRTVVSWNSIIVGFAANGLAEEALEYFELMQKEGFRPDGVSFTGALTACSHVGLVDKGLKYFADMNRVHKLSPRIEHYGCIVDLYSRAGRLEDALSVIEKMTVKPNEIVLGSLLAACRTSGNVGLAEKLVDYLADLDPSIDSNFVLLANIYAAVGRWDGSSKVRRTMKALGIQKKPGISSIEIGCAIHEFVAGDKSHIENEHIYEMLKTLSHDLTLFGYVPEATINDLYGND